MWFDFNFFYLVVQFEYKIMTKIYTDGSSRGNPGPGGYGAVLIMGENVLEIGGRENMTTNNRMEITACIQALNNIPSNLFNEPITLYSDSEYVVKSMTLWISGWQKKGWRTASKKEVLNRDLWEKLLSVSQGKDIKWLHVDGHADNEGNNRCDVIATSFADNNPVKLYSGPLSGYHIGV